MLRANRERGMTQLAQVIMWAVGLAMPIAIAAVSSDIKTNSSQDDKIYNLNGDVSALQANVARIPTIEAKVDKILEREDIDPKDIENAVAAALKAKQAK